MSEKKTEFKNKCLILADLWLNYRDDEHWDDYISYNDLGLPLAYMIANGIVQEEDSSIGHSFINEAFTLLLAGLGIEDEGFELLDDVLEVAEGFEASQDTSATDDDIGVWQSQNEDEAEDEEEQDEWDKAWDIGYESGVLAEQRRIQELCQTYTEMYLDTGKGTKAAMWREVADALKPVDDVEMFSNEDDGL